MRQTNRNAKIGILLLAIGCWIGTASPIKALEVYASLFAFAPPGMGDTHPNLTGVIKIDLDAGAPSPIATPFIPEGTGNAFVLSDVAIGPHDGKLYVSTQIGTILRFNATSGAFEDTFAFFPGAEGGDGVNTLHFRPDGTLYTATGSGIVAKFGPAGSRLPDVATGLTFPSGLAEAPDGSLLVTTGDFGGPGEVKRIDNGVVTTVVASGISGASGIEVLSPRGDYDGNGTTQQNDHTVWTNQFGVASTTGDGNGDGNVDAADYTVWRDALGDESRLLVTDFLGNGILSFALDGTDSGLLTDIPVPLPDPLPPGGIPSNAPSEILVTPQGTLIVSTLGPTQRPGNNGSLLEFDYDGNLLRTIATGLPPISGIAFVPEALPLSTVPEPSTFLLGCWAAGILTVKRRR